MRGGRFCFFSIRVEYSVLRKKNEEYIQASKVHGAKEKEKDAHHEKYVNLKNKR